MKGIVFRSFIDFAEDQLGLEFVDQMLQDLDPESAGVYTNVGTYAHEELLTFVTYIHEQKNLDTTPLIHAFGQHLFSVLHNHYPDMVDCYQDSFECIDHLDQTIHKSVHKIYPNAETPNLNAKKSENQRSMTLQYHSTRPFFELAHGLLMACTTHFGDNVSIDTQKVSDHEGLFTLTKT